MMRIDKSHRGESHSSEGCIPSGGTLESDWILNFPPHLYLIPFCSAPANQI